MRKVLSIIVMVMMMTAVMTYAAFAESESYGIIVGGVEITSENAAAITGDGITGKVSFDPETATLTLENANITGYYKYLKYPDERSGLYTDRDLKVKLVGTNSISHGINDSYGKLEFTGTGSVTVAREYCETGNDETVVCGILSVAKGAKVYVNSRNRTSCSAVVSDNVSVAGDLKLTVSSSQSTFGIKARTEGTVNIASTGNLIINATVGIANYWAVGIQTYDGEVTNRGKLTITAKGGKTSSAVSCRTLTLVNGSSTSLYGKEEAVSADTIKYGSSITCKAGTSSGAAYAAKAGAAFAQKYFKAGNSLGGKVKPTTLKSLSKSGRTMTVKWNKKAAYFVKGYQIQYAANSKFTKGKKTITVKGAAKASKKISKLKKKKYYVRVRTYATVSGKTKYSSWSGYKTKKI